MNDSTHRALTTDRWHTLFGNCDSQRNSTFKTHPMPFLILKTRRFITCSLLAVVFSPGSWADVHAQTPTNAPTPNWAVQTLAGRSVFGEKNATLAIAYPTAALSGTSAQPMRHVLVYPQPGAAPQLKVATGSVALALGGPWVRAAEQLQAQGIAVVYVDPPSDAGTRVLASRPTREVRQDLETAANQAKQLFPAAQIHLASFSSAAPLLDMAGDLDGFGKVVLAGSALGNSRNSDWSALRKPVLMLHAPGAQCDGAPFLEAQMLAKRSRFTFVQVGYERPESKPDCGRDSQHALKGHEAAIAKAVAGWLDGKEIASFIGSADSQVAWREQVMYFPAPGAFGVNQLELTLLLPEGNGPHPVAVFNHGDIEIDSAYARYKRRFVDMTVAREFLGLGWAVAFPARRGVGLSEGTYPLNSFQRGDADTTYKAREHTKDILPALEYLKTVPGIDASRMLVTGQSAGGFAAMHVATLGLPGLVGLVNFSGGRTDMVNNQAPGYLNRGMVNGFAEFGKSTRIASLWVFAENDSRYSPQTIRAAHEAFEAAGGKAVLSLSPPISGDGHFVHHKPELWRAALKGYLTDIGMSNGTR